MACGGDNGGTLSVGIWLFRYRDRNNASISAAQGGGELLTVYHQVLCQPAAIHFAAGIKSQTAI